LRTAVRDRSTGVQRPSGSTGNGTPAHQHSAAHRQVKHPAGSHTTRKSHRLDDDAATGGGSTAPAPVPAPARTTSTGNGNGNGHGYANGQVKHALAVEQTATPKH